MLSEVFETLFAVILIIVCILLWTCLILLVFNKLFEFVSDIILAIEEKVKKDQL